MKQNLPTTWDLSPLFAGDSDPAIKEERERARASSQAFVARWKSRRDYLQDPRVLAEALQEYEEWVGSYGNGGKEMYYASLCSSIEDSADRRAAFNRARAFALDLENEMAFFVLRLARVSAEKRQEFLGAEELRPYRAFLGRLFREAPFLLSESEEKILNMAHAPAHEDWVRMVSGFLSREEREAENEKGERALRGLSELLSLTQSRVKEVRDEAGAGINGVLASHAMHAEAELNAILEHKRSTDALRGMERPDQARHLEDGIETEIVDTMLDAVEKRFDISRRFYALKAAVLGLPVLAYHERNVEMGEGESESSYQEALAITEEAFAVLDGEFAGILQMFAERGQIDAYPRKGKQGGAFCASHLPSHPVYILLNHTGRVRDVLTLAHEAGHGINDELMKKACRPLDFGTSLATAEVASTFMEDFVLQSMRGKTDDDARFALVMDKLNDEISTIFRQVACYRFEQELHRTFRTEGYLSKEKIGTMFQKHMASYMGSAVEQSPGSENWWVAWGHIRRFFYVYSYASGLLVSKALQASVRQDLSFITKVKVFFASGLSAPPRELFLSMGIDISRPAFWERGLLETERLLDEAEGLAKKLKKA